MFGCLEPVEDAVGIDVDPLARRGGSDDREADQQAEGDGERSSASFGVALLGSVPMGGVTHRSCCGKRARGARLKDGWLTILATFARTAKGRRSSQDKAASRAESLRPRNEAPVQTVLTWGITAPGSPSAGQSSVPVRVCSQAPAWVVLLRDHEEL